MGRSGRRALAGGIVVAGTLLSAASALAHDQSALRTAGKGAGEIAELWWFMLAVATVVVGVVTVLALVAVLRRRGRRGEAMSRGGGGTGLVLWAGVVVPFVVLAATFAFTLETIGETAPERDEPRLTIEVTGRQWFWDVRYPGGEATTANEIHIPVGETVRVRARSKDVIHSFWVPSLNRKVDMIPGHTTKLDLHAVRAGVYRGQCAEFCGLQHANMGLFVVAEERAEFEAWVRRQARPAAPLETESARRGRQVFMAAGCEACHTVRGTEAGGDAGPDLTHVGSRLTLAAATIPNDPESRRRWITDPQHVKPGNKMPGLELSRSETRDLVEFLGALR